MATLTIKNLLDALHRQLVARAKRERHLMAQETAAIMAQALGSAPSLSILDLRGLGKELWRGIDAAAYVANERSA